MSEEIIQIDAASVKFLVHRDRDAEGFKLLKESIREYGIRQPLHVRKVEGGWEAAFGEGRTRAAIELHKETGDARWAKVPAIVKEIPTGEVVGRFLSENIVRKDLPWIDQARLIKRELETASAQGRKGSLVVSQLATRFFITPGHAGKLVRILAQTSPRIERELGKLPVLTAERLTKFPATGQEIIIETAAEAGLSPANVETLIAKAKTLQAEGKPLTKTALKQSVQRVRAQLEKLRPQLKLKRLHHAIGPANLEMLLSDPSFRRVADEENIPYEKFLKR